METRITSEALIDFLNSNFDKLEFVQGRFSMRTVNPNMYQLPADIEGDVFKLSTSSRGLKSIPKYRVESVLMWVNQELQSK